MASDGPITQYRQRVAEGELRDDPAQRHAVEQLQMLWSRLRGYEPSKPKKVRKGLFGWGKEETPEADMPGLYIWGGVGRGKSMLMNMFFDSAPVEPKRRVHFHEFMQEVHGLIGEAREKGTKDSMGPVVEKIAASATLLCFDEMQITDITDAMIVGRLFEGLFARGIVVVTTSNRHPDDLYKDGLNRQLFLPFIDLIKEKLEVYHLDSANDHRQGGTAREDSYLIAPAPKALDAAWEDMTGGAKPEALTLELKSRKLTFHRFAKGVVRTDFEKLCENPLGAGDYLALAKKIDGLILEGVPRLHATNFDAAKRFVTLVDALYEAKIELVIEAAAEPENLYAEGTGSFEFERTASRLHEMRAKDWP
ncbi:cell division protein ZapE [Paracoccaceae bacterium GXU_MW_L88]